MKGQRSPGEFYIASEELNLTLPKHRPMLVPLEFIDSFESLEILPGTSVDPKFRLNVELCCFPMEVAVHLAEGF